jgi:hypothetical protein
LTFGGTWKIESCFLEKNGPWSKLYLAILENIEIPIGNKALTAEVGIPAIFQEMSEQPNIQFIVKIL